MKPDPPPRPIRQYLDSLGTLCAAFRGALDTPILGAASDSREIRPGWLFCAIPGSRTDGAAYIPEALERGAVAIAAPAGVAVPPEVPLFTVTDAYAAAGRIAECLHGHPARALALYGITGTNGKTTTAFILRALFAAAGIPCGMIGTVEYDTGAGPPTPARRTTPTPFELQKLLADMVAADRRAAVLEVSSHALVQSRLGTARFAGAVFTNLTRDHLDYHESLEAYFRAKQRLFSPEHLPAKAPAVIHCDDPRGRDLYARLRRRGHEPVIGFGRTAEADVRVTAARVTPAGSRFTLAFTDEPPLELDSPLVGAYNVANLAGAIALARAAGVPRAAIRSAVRACRGAPGRLQAVPADDAGFAVYVDYAHTDDALKKVLATLRDLGPRRLIVVFGCGGDRDRAKRPLMGEAAAEHADLVIVTSDNPRGEDPDAIIAEITAGIPAGTACLRIPDRRAAIRAAVAEARPGDIVLIAGKGHETTQEIRGRFEPFDDVREAAAALAAKGA